MSFCDPLFHRLALAGPDYSGYDSGFRGTASKLITAISTIALLTVAILATKGFFVQALSPTIAGLSGALSLFFILGSSKERESSASLLQIAISMACIMLVVLSEMQKLTNLEAMHGVIGVVAGSLLLNTITVRGKIEVIQPFPSSEKKLEEHVTEEEVDTVRSCLLLRIVDNFLGFGRDTTFMVKSGLTWITHAKNYQNEIVEPLDTTGLIVLIQGLRVPPCTLDSYFDEFKKKAPHATIFQPKIKDQGNGNLEAVVDSIYPQIQTFAQKYPLLPISLIGLSHGGRLAAEIARRLANNSRAISIDVHAIGAPFNGTKFINQPSFPRSLQNLWNQVFKTVGYTQDVLEELSYNSPSSQTFVQQISKTKASWNFYVGGADWMIRPIVSALPRIENGNYFYSPTEGHGSITRTIQPTVVQKVLSQHRSKE